MSSRRARSALVAAGASAALALVAFGPQVVGRLASKPISAPALATVAVRSFSVSVTASGTVQAQSAYDVNFAVGGQVAAINVRAGSTVQRGQILATLDDSTQQAEIQAAQTAVGSAEVVLTQAQSGAFPNDPAAVAQAQAALAGAQLQLQRARSDDARTVLTAPAAGTVLAVNGVAGGSAVAGTTGAAPIAGAPGSGSGPPPQPFILMGNAAALDVVAAFSQQDATMLKPGQPGTVSFDALPGITATGAIGTIAGSATLVNGVPEFFVSVSVIAADARLRSGMSANVSVNVAQASNVLAVANQAVYTLDNVPHVDVWDGTVPVPTAVSIGLVGSQLTQITSGLSEGQQVVLTAQHYLPTPIPGASSTSG